MEWKTDHFLFGGDYNPEQWMDEPGILDEDIRLMKEAGVNTVSLGIFAWAKEEPEEGRYELDWLADIIHRLYDNGISTILATPSGARPRWLAEKYPEVLRVNERREKLLFGGRHNHCLTSKVYREKVAAIDRKLAERFGKDPAVILWHISNEFSGECDCPKCQSAFRSYVKDKYQTVDAMNHAWWANFWSHTYTSFDQVESPSSLGEDSIQGLELDWRRFCSDEIIDFMQNEIDALRAGGATQPVTTNMMHDFDGINYGHMAKHIDVVSWDSYPTWWAGNKTRTMEEYNLDHDFMRSLKDQPFLMMESCTTGTNWQQYSDLKRPGQYTNEALSAVAHGSQSVLIFQIRQGRGSSEKFHGALIDHYGRDDTRVYRECAALGKTLKDLSEVLDSEVRSEVAIMYDVENRWAVERTQGPRNADLPLRETALKFYHAFARLGIETDVIDEEHDLSQYKVLVLPMIYSMRKGLEDRVRKFVEDGGTLVMTCLTAITDETDLVHIKGWPHGLMDVAGLRAEEIDSRPDNVKNTMIPAERNSLSIQQIYTCSKLFDLIKLTTAEALMTYGRDFYAGRSAFSVNNYGKGKAYYVSSCAEDAFYIDVMDRICDRAGVRQYLGDLPENVIASFRENDSARYIFLQNFGENDEDVDIPSDITKIYPTKEKAGRTVTVPGMGTLILRQDK